MSDDPLESDIDLMPEQPKRSAPVGAPTELADAEEVPGWFADLVKALSAMPLLIGFLCGGVPIICGILWCILQVLL